jgi:hypothetical protein
MQRLNMAILAILTIAVTVVALVLFPEGAYSTSFWMRVVWLFVLIVFNWGLTSIFFFSGKNIGKSSFFSVLPSITVVVFGYSLYSVVLLIADMWWLSPFLGHLFLAFQIAGAAVAAIICLFMLLAAKGVEAKETDLELWKKHEVIQNINALREKLPSDFAHKISMIAERAQYALPPLGGMKSVDAYKELKHQLQDMLDKPQELANVAITLDKVLETIERC